MSVIRPKDSAREPTGPAKDSAREPALDSARASARGSAMGSARGQEGGTSDAPRKHPSEGRSLHVVKEEVKPLSDEELLVNIKPKARSLFWTVNIYDLT